MGETTRYAVLEWKVDHLLGLIDRLNRKARKLGCAEIHATVAGEEYKTFPPRKLYPGDDFPAPPRIIRFVLLDIEGDAPSLNGWTFIGTVEHGEGPNGGKANILRAVPGHTIPEDYRHTAPVCEHCRTARYRRDTYVVQHEDGTTKQIGKQCLKDFLGHASPHQYAAFAVSVAELFADLDYTCPDEDSVEYSGHGGGYWYFEASHYLPWVVASIRAYGWKSATQARDYGGIATASAAIDCMMERDQTKVKDEAKPTDADAALAEAALAWIHAADAEWYADNQYRTNLYYLAQREFLGFRDLGLIASLIPTYTKAMQIELEQKKARAESHHIGEVGKRGTWTMTCTRIHETDGGQFGPTYITSFIEGDGNRVVWFASAAPRYLVDGCCEAYVEQGDVVEIKATVKEHGEYKGIPQTIITRAKILRILPKAEDAPTA